MVGKLGTVYLSIEAGGLGEILLNVSGATQTYMATSSAAIARGDDVLVTGKTDDGILIVDTWFAPPNATTPQDNQ